MKTRGGRLCLDRNVGGVENGERLTKYFFNVEKKNYKKETITELRMEDDSISNNEKLILDTIEKYYQGIYSFKRNTLENDFNGLIEHLEIPKLADEDRDGVEGPLTVSECKSILDAFQADKTPGKDGFGTEFYKSFFELFGED